MSLLKMCGPQNRHCLFTFWPIVLKQLNSLTTVDTFSWLGGPEVTGPTVVIETPGSIPGSQGFVCMICYIVVVVVGVVFFPVGLKHIIYHAML